MLLIALLVVAVALLVGTAVLQRRTRHKLLGEHGHRASAALGADGGDSRTLAREQARQESHAVRRVSEGGF